jgi:hypothetical protein
LQLFNTVEYGDLLVHISDHDLKSGQKVKVMNGKMALLKKRTSFSKICPVFIWLNEIRRQIFLVKKLSLGEFLYEFGWRLS